MGKCAGRRFCSTTSAVSGNVARYHCSMPAPASVATMPSQASLLAMLFFSAASLNWPATMPPTTAVMVNMKAVRMPSWAKVLGP